MASAEIHLLSDGITPLAEFIEMAGAVHKLVDYIHLREKHCSARQLLAAAEQMKQKGLPAAKLVINDRIDVALAADAGGVQLSWRSLEPIAARPLAPNLRLGSSVHSPEGAAEAARQGADYCLYGHVYPSSSKPKLPERGLGMLAETVRRSPIPVIAIGGIVPENAGRIIRQGAAGIAVMSGICGAEDPLAAAMAYCSAVQELQQIKGGSSH